LEPDDFVDSGFPILHKGAIKANGIIGIDAKKKTFATPAYAAACPKNIVNREFVAVTLRDLVPAGPSIGFTADLRNGPFDEYLLAQGAYGFRVNRERVVPEYLVHLSNNENFRHVLRQNAVGSTQIHIRTPVYLAIRVPLPPIALQQEFARRVGAVEKLKAAQRTALAEQDALFATLQHRAFRGEL
jgi:type I restriction enzyme S subunit